MPGRRGALRHQELDHRAAPVHRLTRDLDRHERIHEPDVLALTWKRPQITGHPFTHGAEDRPPQASAQPTFRGHGAGWRLQHVQHWCCRIVVEEDCVGCLVGSHPGEVEFLARDVSDAVAAFDLVGRPELFEVAARRSAKRLLRGFREPTAGGRLRQ